MRPIDVGPVRWDHRYPQPSREDSGWFDTGIKDVEFDAATLRVLAAKVVGLVLIAVAGPAADWERVLLVSAGGGAVAAVWAAGEHLLRSRKQIGA